MAYKIKSKAGRKANYKKGKPKIYSIKKMLPKKYRKKYRIEIKEKKLYLYKK